MTIRVLLVDDHEIMCDGLKSLLGEHYDMEVVAMANDGRNALKLALEFEPHVVIMDIAMPDLNGIEATRQIIAGLPNVKVIALSMHSDRRFISKMLRVGASGYILKDCAGRELVHAIRTVIANHTYLSSKISEIVTEDYVHYLVKEEFPTSKFLTPREREVLQLFAEGKTTKEIASSLYVSMKTVEVHRKNIMDKLNIHSIAGLIKYAIREGLTFLET